MQLTLFLVMCSRGIPEEEALVPVMNLEKKVINCLPYIMPVM